MHYTKKQYAVMKFIAEYIAAHGIPPTLEEVGRNFNVCKVTIFEHLKMLEKKGAIRRRKGLSRSVELLDEQFATPSPTRVPLVGRIAAGRPIEAIENPQTVDLSALIPRDKECYLLRVKGDSMIDEHIADGDYVIVEKRETARDGQIVVAIINDNEATLKRLYREGRGFRLEPANPSVPPIHTNRVDVRGVVIGVLRKY
ncbi:MAG: transcriptional repressor LexA [Planctomycetota bacterium]